jgi:hypothetical protein
VDVTGSGSFSVGDIRCIKHLGSAAVVRYLFSFQFLSNN